MEKFDGDNCSKSSWSRFGCSFGMIVDGGPRKTTFSTLAAASWIKNEMHVQIVNDAVALAMTCAKD
jgi:hypothetical protein